MFLIIDIIPMLKVLKSWKGTCQTCHQEGEIELVMSFQCLRLFFMPIVKWQKTYFLRHSCGAKLPMEEDVALRILSGQVDITTFQFEHGTPKQEHEVKGVCPNCGRQSEEDYKYCPYCGHQKL